MIIGAINHDSMHGSIELLKRLGDSLNTLKNEHIVADMIIAPSSGLIVPKATLEHRPNNTTERYNLLEQLKQYSSENPNTYLLPGSMFWYNFNNQEKIFQTYASAPVFHNGKLKKEFFKERNNGESWAAGEFAKIHNKKVTHKNGDNKDNYFNMDGTLVSVELCGDHGNQLSQKADLEIILAYDNKGGFYMSAANDSWSRSALLCNGYDGSSTAWTYDADKTELNLITPMNIKNLKYMNLFNISIGKGQ